MKYYETLGDDARERLFALMRELDEEAERWFKRGRETPGTVPVGAALFDDTLRGAARMELVWALRLAPTIDLAAEWAARKVRIWVEKHNARRPRDVNWQRWSEAGQADLESLVARARTVVRPANDFRGLHDQELGKECDWGYCDKPAAMCRWNGNEWLPCCVGCSQSKLN